MSDLHSETLPQTEPTRPANRDNFRDGMAHLAAGVNVITTDGPAGRAGFTATAVCSVTDTPPTLLVCINRTSSAAPAFAQNTALCVNVIGPETVAVAQAFGRHGPMEARFEGALWTPGLGGAPVLNGANVAFDCKIVSRKVVGTHEVMFAEVLGMALRPEASASVYFGRSFHTVSAQ